ncbi:MAG: TlpA disulfide reductase family protein [Bryobacteraceae bacterium]|jgi:peroxiredoxin
MIQAGQQAPGFSLERLDGGHATLAQLLESGPLALVFFKASCPTCQLALPFLDRLCGSALRVFAVSQDEAARTREFLRLFPLQMPVLLDSAAAGYPASNAYGIRYVPSLFVIEPDGVVSAVCEAFDRRAYESLAARAGRPMFSPGESVPLYKPG